MSLPTIFYLFVYEAFHQILVVININSYFSQMTTLLASVARGVYGGLPTFDDLLVLLSAKTVISMHHLPVNSFIFICILLRVLLDHFFQILDIVLVGRV